jgi:hypothetical protein
MYTLIGAALVSLLVAGTPTGPIMPAESDAIHDWPAVKQGVWSIEGTLKGKKRKKWKATTRRCGDATTLFQGYWGRGKADEKNDCLFQSTKLSESRFEIVGECLVDQNDVVKSQSLVTMKGAGAFQMEVKFQTGKVTSKAKETGRWIAACTDAEKAAAESAPNASSTTASAPSAPTATAKNDTGEASR